MRNTSNAAVYNFVAKTYFLLYNDFVRYFRKKKKTNVYGIKLTVTAARLVSLYSTARTACTAVCGHIRPIIFEHRKSILVECSGMETLSEYYHHCIDRLCHYLCPFIQQKNKNKKGVCETVYRSIGQSLLRDWSLFPPKKKLFVSTKKKKIWMKCWFVGWYSSLFVRIFRYIEFMLR